MRLNTLPAFYFTVSNAIDTITKKQGSVILSKDEQKLFIDADGSTRIPLTDIIHITNEDMLPLSALDKFYIDNEKGNMFIDINGEWVKFTNQENTTIKVQKDDAIYQPNVIIGGNGIDVEEDAETGNVTLTVALNDYELSFTSSDLDASGILTVTNARVGSFVIIDNNGRFTLPAMTQVGDNVQVNLYEWEVNGTWTIFFPMGCAASNASINNIVNAILSSNYITSAITAPSTDVEEDKVYTFTNPLLSLELHTVEHGHRQSEIRFTPTASFSFTYATGATGIVGIIGSIPTFEVGKYYFIYIRDGYMEIKTVTPVN